MKKVVKIILIVVGIIVGIVVLDTLQARILKNSPIISWKEGLADEDSYVDRGILIDTYYCVKERDMVTVSWHLKTTKVNCPIDNVNPTYQDIIDKINKYFATDESDKSNFAYLTMDEEKNVVVVGMMDIREEKQKEFINNVFSNDYSPNYMQQIIEKKMIEFRESKDVVNGRIIEAKENSITIEVLEDSKALKKNDKVTMKIARPTNGTNDFYVVGNKVRITFNGFVETSNPAQIGATTIELITE